MPALALIALGASLIFDPLVRIGDSPVCPVRRLTGIPCPSCGLTRSFVAIGNGDLGTAFAFHPLGPALYLGLIAVVLRAVIAIIRNRPIRRTRVETTVGIGLAVALLVIGGARLITHAGW